MNGSARYFLAVKAVLALSLTVLTLQPATAELALAVSPGADDFILAGGKTVAAIFVETNDERAVLRAAGDLADDFAQVTGTKPEIVNQFSPDKKIGVIIGTIGKSKIIDRLAAEGKLATNGISGQWESHVLQVVKNPLPGVGHGAGDCRQRPARHDLRDLSVVGNDRRFAVVLVGGRAGEAAKNLWRCAATFSSKARPP